jgi:hypothetical protein
VHGNWKAYFVSPALKVPVFLEVIVAGCLLSDQRWWVREMAVFIYGVHELETSIIGSSKIDAQVILRPYEGNAVKTKEISTAYVPNLEPTG